MIGKLAVLASLIFVSVGAFGAEWCPRYNGVFPAAVVDVGQYRSYYFAPDSIYSESGQTAVVYVVKNNRVINISTARGYSDWFSDTTYSGPKNGFSCDSMTLQFNSAWLIDENGRHKDFKFGQVRGTNFKANSLICSSML